MVNPSLSLFDFYKSLTCALIDIIYPPFCPICDKSIEKYEICRQCLDRLDPIKGPLCSLCGQPFKTDRGENHPCGICLKKPPSFDKAASVFVFRGKAAEAIYKLKYSKKTCLAGLLGDFLAFHPMTEEGFDVIIPVPLHLDKLRERGFNQSYLLAKRIGKICQIKTNPLLLERKKATLPQVGMKSRERILNVKEAFGLRADADPADIKGRRILLVDDVYTTGATLKECSKVLKKKGAEKVYALTLARATDL